MKTAWSCNRGIEHGPLKHASFALSICHCRFSSNKLRKHPQLGGDFDVFNMKSRRICTLKIVVLCRISCSTVRDISRQPNHFGSNGTYCSVLLNWICVSLFEIPHQCANFWPTVHRGVICQSNVCLPCRKTDQSLKRKAASDKIFVKWHLPLTVIKQHSTGHQNGPNLHNLVNFDNLKVLMV